MSRLIIMSGQKFGRLTAIKHAYTDRHNAMWTAVCDCGRTTIVAGNHLRTGNTQSCGCLDKEHRVAFVADMAEMRRIRREAKPTKEPKCPNPPAAD